MTVLASQHADFADALLTAVATKGDLHVDAPARLKRKVVLPNPSGLRVHGHGDATPVICELPTGDCMVFGDGVAEVRNLLLQDFAVLPKSNRTSGWAIAVRKGVRWSIDNVDVGLAEHPAMHWGGLWADGYDDSRIDDANFYCSDEAVLVNGKSNQSYGADLVIGGGTKIQTHRRPDGSDRRGRGIGLHLAGGQGGTYVDAMQAIYCDLGILIDTVMAGVTNREVFLNPGCVVDSCWSDGIRVMENAVGTLQGTGIWTASHGRGGAGDGLRVHGAQHGTFHFTGSRFFNNKKGTGYAANGGVHHLVGNVIDDNDVGLYKSPNAFVNEGLNLIHRNRRNVAS